MVCLRSSGFESFWAFSDVVLGVWEWVFVSSGSIVRYEVFSMVSVSRSCCSARSRPRSSRACVLLVVVASFRNWSLLCRVLHRGHVAVSGSGVMIHSPVQFVHPTTACVHVMRRGVCSSCGD